MGSENAQSNPRAASSRPGYMGNSMSTANDPYARQTGLRGGLVQGIGQARASEIGKGIDEVAGNQQAAQARIAERRRNQTALRSEFDAQQIAARSTGIAPVFRPGQQIFK
jgi:hypothetical protein